METPQPRALGLVALNACVLTAIITIAATGQQADIPKTFSTPTADWDYVQREVMVPMRDGVKLYTVILVPKGAKDAPIVFSRTPYSAAKATSRNESPHML